MIPLLIVVRVRWVRLWIPLFVVWILLLPLVLVLLPFAVLACFIVRINPLKAILTFWGLFSAFRGTTIDVDDGKNLVAVQIF